MQRYNETAEKPNFDAKKRQKSGINRKNIEIISFLP
jgi:hypothetical protein